MNSTGIIATAGAVSFAGNWKEQEGYPTNGTTIIVASLVLMVVFSFSKGGPLETPVKALAGLSLLAALIRYVPKLSTNTGKK